MAEYGSAAVANTGLGLGIAGTALGVLNGGLGNVLGGIGGGNAANSAIAGLAAAIPGMINAEDKHVTRHELDLLLRDSEKDAEIADLKSQQYTDSKLVDVYKELASQVNAVRTEVRANKDEQSGINMQQAVYNGTNTATIGFLQSQISALQAITKTVIPNSSVCPGWGDVTIKPAS